MGCFRLFDSHSPNDPKPPKSPLLTANKLLANLRSQLQCMLPSNAQQGCWTNCERKQEEPFTVTSVSWAPACKRCYHLIATGGQDGCVRIWKVRPPEPEADESGAETIGSGVWNATVVADFDEHQSLVGRVEWNITG
jgi:nucleoporin SEH1